MSENTIIAVVVIGTLAILLTSKWYKTTLIQKIIYLDIGKRIPRKYTYRFYRQVDMALEEKDDSNLLEEEIISPQNYAFGRLSIVNINIKIAQRYNRSYLTGLLLEVPIVGTTILYSIYKELQGKRKTKDRQQDTINSPTS